MSISESHLQLLSAKVSDEDHRYLRERGRALGLSMAGVVRFLITRDRRGASDSERQARPSFLDSKLCGKVFGLAMKGVDHLNLPTRGRVAVVDAEALEELFGVFCALTGQDPATLKPMSDEEVAG